MGVGTFDISQVPADLSSTQRRQGVVYTGPSAYVTGGDPLNPNTVARMGLVNEVLGQVASDGTTAYLLWYNKATGKIMWFVASTGVEVANGVVLSAVVARIEIVGR